MLNAEQHIIRLEECTGDCVDLVGGKATGLGALLSHRCQVPPGFAITTHAYREFVQSNCLAAPLQRMLADGASEDIRGLFESSRVPARLEDQICSTYAALCGGLEAPVAVRSSATAEDLANASFAGLQQTHLWIMGGAAVVRHVVRCWASLFSPQAIAYRAHLATPVADLAMGVVVQRMVPAEAAGVMMTIDPVTGDRSTVMIEAAYGLGVAVVNGEVTPDLFCIDKPSLAIRSRTMGDKSIAYRFDPGIQRMHSQEVPPSLQTQPCLTDEEVLRLAEFGNRLERAMGCPLDIEWAIGPSAKAAREIFLLQARPETVWSQKGQGTQTIEDTSLNSRLSLRNDAPPSRLS